jgi:Phosphodiester glycosidase/PEP-CTERM motif
VVRKTAGLLLALGLWSVGTARADITYTSDNPFLGVTHLVGVGTIPGTSTPTVVNAVDINLSAPGIGFAVSPGTTVGGVGMANVQTTTSFVTSVGAQIGINANFFDGSVVSGPAAVNGLAASAGNLYAPTSNGPTLSISATNVVSILSSLNGQTLFNAVSGNFQIVTNGVDTAPVSTEVSARTAVGLTASGHLLLFTVDGSQGSSPGMTFDQEAQTLIGLGVVNAINLDGGSSTTLAFGSQVINSPVFGIERPVAVNLAIFASAVPEPSTFALLALGGIGLIGFRTRRLPV